jgi:hypothetical protein
VKNIQVIDGADNCAYDIYAASDDDFAALFPGDGQDIEFIEDFLKRVKKARAQEILTRLWTAPADKKKLRGIHGTLFYQLERTKKRFYPTKRETDLDDAGGRPARDYHSPRK